MSEYRYGGWARDGQGWLFGLTGPAWAAASAAGIPALAAAAGHRWRLAAGWLPIWALAVVAVAVPVRGRSMLRWLADAALARVGAAMGWTAWQSRVAAGTGTDPGRADLPGVLAGIRIHDGPPCGPLLARPVIVQNLTARTWAVVARVRHPGIGLAESPTRARMAAGLSDLLEGAAAGELMSLLVLQVRTVPDDGGERAAWAWAHLRPDAPRLALAVDAELSSVMVAAGVRHEVFVTVVVPEQRLARHARDAGGGLDGRARLLYGVMGEVEARLLGSVGCTGVAWLDSAGMATAIRTGFAPGDAAALSDAAVTDLDAAPWSDRGGRQPAAGVPVAAAGPGIAPSPMRRCYVHDAWSSVTAAVLLPDKGAIMGALAPVFVPTQAGERRCVSVFFEPISRGRADRLVGQDSMSAGTAAELRSRMGFVSRAAHRQAADRVAGQDVRLAEGKALLRVAAVAAVTVPSSWPVDDFGARLEASIRGSGFTPLRLDLAQDSGFAAACIPVGIGLARQRGLG